MEESAAGEGAGGREDTGVLGGASGDSHHQPSNGRNRALLPSCRPPVIIAADPPLPAVARAPPQVPTAAARRSAVTGALVSSWRSRFASSASDSTSHHSARATTASRGQPQHHRQHQAAAPVEVSPGDDADKGGDDSPGRTDGDDGNGDERGTIQEATKTATNLEADNNMNRGRGVAQRGDLEEEDESGDGPPSSRPFRVGSSSGGRGSSSRVLSLVGLGDIPDAPLARVFFSGFLDSLEVASSLRLVNRRIMAVASTACRIMDLHGIPLSDQDLANVAVGFPCLVHVDLSFCKGLGDGIGTSLRPCHRTLQALEFPPSSILICIRLALSKSLRGMGVSSAVVEDLRQFCQLTHLDISQSVARDSRKVTPASLIEGLPGLERLTKLSLAWNKGVTDAVVEQLCNGVRCFTELDLSLCAQITFRSIQALSAQRFLRVLSLRACVHVSDDTVEELVVACPGLSTLDLAHLPRLTGRSLRALVLLRELKRLDLRCCELLTTADVVAFRTSRPSTRVAELRAWWT